MTKGLILLAAGGTGGHLFPAEALAHELRARGYSVHLVTDSRAERYAGKFPADAIHVVPSATIGSKNPVAIAKALLTLWRGYRAARTLIASLKPLVVIGFGGYPTIPPLLAARALGVATVIHEQNAVMGRANRFLAPRVKAIAGGFLPAGGAYADKTVVTGNPVRPAVLAASETDYQPSGDGDPFELVVFGGSQGAQHFSNAVPSAICILDDVLRARLRVTQQARPEDADRVKALYEKLKVPASVSPFFGDMAERIGASQMVISRSGASTVSELGVIGRPAVLVPYPYALDHDQAANAAAISGQGGAVVVPQSDLTPEKLSALLKDWMTSPAKLAHMAASARSAGQPEAAGLLADLVQTIAEGRQVKTLKDVKA
ncbi:undecaprenyldiphospho-muramoylpentapeptide beta-N-acetylglucosaminyltransferase [Agrobacterium vitis]|uniref:UDP-N-acetylglucosamine--N-acetylmuramyl-(pentapeptide) pyrophosphoryl-undecaprenol N-acetylglucosamine transferase n=1 Tax=Agrobacterium vitis TaxID=373 RepID=A0A368NI36_AGRVI|nr:undecaprenyldiphospho-muramoylpentapeptide beta-N-acetylglucosaminyltransferase [Agrobacterium vitis]KAA3512645.1 undecaprenyldiphospho-muramoylpentapeptide beta-N-acetylglucosaminyltransferase [Agrobacterium vitis]KAA3526012.1 undecaprenyldiphospho-muramoylpentapeptide beta-N-acetylglucosaminyltransferase [Agrobacterium vitis]MCF1478262.1 undecaprenyldiphospho-muramoylpentapeptide beta-N-acetylglucosaminyltransferase [Agrobacterium vitis]MUZ99023.1 undecaprenyldiphospho-muramoylpentapeptide